MESDALTFPKNHNLTSLNQGSNLSANLKPAWRLLHVPETSLIFPWLISRTGVDLVGVLATNGYFEVVVPASLDLTSICLDLDIIPDYDPAEPTEQDLQAFGTKKATERAHVAFIYRAIVLSDSHPSYVECCYGIARLHGLTTPLERGYLVHDILVCSTTFDLESMLTFPRNSVHRIVHISRNAWFSLA